MKKTILFLAFCFAGLMSAASPSDNETVKVTVSEEMRIIEQKLYKDAKSHFQEKAQEKTETRF